MVLAPSVLAISTVLSVDEESIIITSFSLMVCWSSFANRPGRNVEALRVGIIMLTIEDLPEF